MDGLLVSFLDKWSYLGLFLILMAAGLGLPLPEDIPLVAAGWLVHQGQADLWLMIATGLVGVLLGDSILFLMGRRYGSDLVERPWLRRIAKPWLLDKAQRMYTNHGAKILFAARFMPGLRAVLFLTAGVFRVPYWKFILIDGLAAMLSVPAWIWLSSRFSGRVVDLLGGAKVATRVMIGALLAALFIWGIWEYFHNLRKRNVSRDNNAVDVKTHTAPVATPPDQTAATPSETKNGQAAPPKAKAAELV